MFQAQYRETVNITWEVAVSFKIIMTTSVTINLLSTVPSETNKCKLRKNAQWRAASEPICLSMLAAHNENNLSICWLTKWGTKAYNYITRPCFTTSDLQDQDQDRHFWSHTGLVLRPTVSDHVTVIQCFVFASMQARNGRTGQAEDAAGQGSCRVENQETRRDVGCEWRHKCKGVTVVV